MICFKQTLKLDTGGPTKTIFRKNIREAANFVNDSDIKALTPPPFDLKGSRNFAVRFFFPLMARPLPLPPP